MYCLIRSVMGSPFTVPVLWTPLQRCSTWANLRMIGTALACALCLLITLPDRSVCVCQRQNVYEILIQGKPFSSPQQGCATHCPIDHFIFSQQNISYLVRATTLLTTFQLHNFRCTEQVASHFLATRCRRQYIFKTLSHSDNNSRLC